LEEKNVTNQFENEPVGFSGRFQVDDGNVVVVHCGF
jgi:hypothetical protein